jgi:hypothetical protein
VLGVRNKAFPVGCGERFPGGQKAFQERIVRQARIAAQLFSFGPCALSGALLRWRINEFAYTIGWNSSPRAATFGDVLVASRLG